ncbi:hypothetical protein ACFPFQ_19430 [Pseudonocardia sp. GCM10023141]
MLWRPGVDPAERFKSWESGARAKRIAALAAGTIVTLLVLAAAVFAIGAAFATGFWWGILSILGSLTIGGVALAYTYDAVGKTVSNPQELFKSFIADSFGKDCFVSWEELRGGPFASRGSAAGRVAAAIGSIQESYSLKTGWLSRETLVRAHGDAWSSLMRASKASPDVREAHLSEVAESLESVATQVAALDMDLLSRERADELKGLQEDFLEMRNRTEALSDDVILTRRFLMENPE